MSRRRGFAGLRRSHPILYLVVAIIGGLGTYWGKPSLFSSFKAAPAGGDTETVVERVVDGDTLVISGGDRVRLIGVDTPETKHPTKPPQPFGKEASEFTRQQVEGKRVQLRFDPGETKDKYGRTLAYVYVDGQFLNEMLVRAGLARAMTNYPFSSDMKRVFRDAEAAAQAEHRGIWSLPSTPTESGTGGRHRQAAKNSSGATVRQ